jgi:hypothetical protein
MIFKVGNDFEVPGAIDQDQTMEIIMLTVIWALMHKSIKDIIKSYEAW